MFFIIVLFPFSGFGQFTVISADANQVLYAGLKNPITIVSESCPCKSLVVKTKLGKLTGTGCQYEYIIPVDSIKKGAISKPTILVYQKVGKNLKSLANWSFRIKMIPDPFPCILPVWTEKDTTIDYGIIQENTFYDGHERGPGMTGQRAFADNNIELSYTFFIDSFRFSIFRGDSCIQNQISNIGWKFTKETCAIFKTTENNDKIVFDKIHSTGTDGSHRILKSFFLRVKNKNYN